MSGGSFHSVTLFPARIGGSTLPACPHPGSPVAVGDPIGGGVDVLAEMDPPGAVVPSSTSIPLGSVHPLSPFLNPSDD